jgi:glucose/arabinose dehydrogenase
MRLLVLFTMLACERAPASPQSPPPPPPVVIAAENVPFTLGPPIGPFSRPVFVTHAGDGSGRLFVVEQTGKIKVVKGDKVVGEFYDGSTLLGSDGGEMGMLGLAFHPKFKDNGRLFIAYTDSERDDAYAELKATADKSKADASSLRVLFSIDDFAGNHNGGNLAFGPDGLLYMGTGDGGGANDPQRTAQDDRSFLGKMLRLDVDKLPPPSPTGVTPDMFAKGLRNPWRYSFDRQTGDLLIGDVGQNKWEWVHYVPRAELKPGINFGWSVVEGSHCFRPSSGCETKGLRAPVFEYAHGEDGCSITGGYVYRGKAIPALVGVYLVGDYCSGRVWMAKNEGGAWKFTKAMDSKTNISSFGEDEDGEMYLVDHKGDIRKLIPRQ